MKASERGVAGVDQTQAEEIEMSGAGDMALGKIFRWPDVDDAEIRPSRVFSASRLTVVSKVSRLYCFSIGSL